MALASPQPRSTEPERLGTGTPDGVDPDLLRLSPRPSVIQLLLTLVVMGFAGFVGWTFRLDLAYYFADTTPVEIGAVEDLAVALDENPDLLWAYGSNVYAHLSGVAHRRAVTSTKQYHQLVGGAIFVEEERQDGGPMWQDIRLRIPVLDGMRERTYLDSTGRFLRFEDLGRKHRGFIAFYQDGYNIHFCSQEPSRLQQQYLRYLREELRQTLETRLGSPPTEDQLDQAVAEEFPCQHGFLFQAGKAPGDQLGYLLLYALLLLVEVIGMLFVVRWARRTWAAMRA